MGYQTWESHLLSAPQHTPSNMKVLSVFMACLMACQGFVVPATTLVRAPSHDSAVIRSDRLGGNFAYSVQEGHAYAAVSPVVQHVSTLLLFPTSLPLSFPPPTPSTLFPLLPSLLKHPNSKLRPSRSPKSKSKLWLPLLP